MEKARINIEANTETCTGPWTCRPDVAAGEQRRIENPCGLHKRVGKRSARRKEELNLTSFEAGNDAPG